MKTEKRTVSIDINHSEFGSFLELKLHQQEKGSEDRKKNVPISIRSKLKEVV